MKIIQLDYEMDLFYHMDSFLDYHVKYLGDRFLNIKIRDIFDTIRDLNKDFNNQELTDEQIFLNYAKGNEEQFLKEFMLEFEPDVDYKNLKEVLDNNYIYELIDLFIDLYDGENNIIDLCKTNNCDFGTVGYSNWTYYITHKEIDVNFVSDLWEGRNWYILSLIQDNEVVESIGGMYITDLKELDKRVKENFGIEKDDYFVVENDMGQYIDKPKVKEIKHVRYTYKKI